MSGNESKGEFKPANWQVLSENPQVWNELLSEYWKGGNHNPVKNTSTHFKEATQDTIDNIRNRIFQ